MSRVAPLGPVDYSSVTVPPLYHCGKCGALGVKLWREYNAMLEHQSLMCGDCACKSQSKNGKTHSVKQIEAPPGSNVKSRICVTTVYDKDLQPQLNKAYGGSWEGGDQIGWYIPAVPTADGETYWGYTSVPEEGCDWWDRLPLRL